MLTIPGSVQTLFRTDGVHKNFRVHFPGGELPDITNDSVAQESVRFTESLCSQDQFRFGLAENSVLEFEAVGVANMYGMTIEAGMEIDLGSLSASEIASIKSNPRDGRVCVSPRNMLSLPDIAERVLDGVSVTRTDGRYIFSGTKSTNTQRTASGSASLAFGELIPGETYTLSMSGALPNGVSIGLNYLRTSETIGVLTPGVTAAQPVVTFTVPANYANLYDCTVTITAQSGVTVSGDVVLQLEAGSKATSALYYSVPLGTFRVESCPRDHRAMAHRKVTAYSYVDGLDDALVSPYMAWKLDRGYSLGASKDYASSRQFAQVNLQWADPSTIPPALWTEVPRPASSQNVTVSIPARFIPHPQGSNLGRISSASVVYVPHVPAPNYDAINAVEKVADVDLDGVISEILAFTTGTFTDDQRRQIQRWISPALVNDVTNFRFDDTNMFPVGDGIPAAYNAASDPFTIYVPYQLILTLTAPGGATGQKTLDLWDTYPVKVYVDMTFDANAVPMSIPSTGSVVVDGVTYYTSVDALDLAAFMGGFVEASGKFLRISRARGGEIMALDPASPVSILGSDYDQGEMWWDEYDVSPIGTVAVTYRAGEEGEATANVILGDGASVYDMTDNEFFRAISASTPEDLATLLSGDFADNADNVGFTPVDMVMRALPWIEAGDALEITAEDGTVVDTYALRIEMSGIQHLTATIEAKGGTIIGEV